MRTTTLLTLRMIALIMLITSLWSCSKEKAQPAAAPVNSFTDEQLMSPSLLPGEISVETVTPGTYRIAGFIDTGDDETAQFNGYRFEFQADGDLIATTNTGARFNGRWRLNSQETRMTIEIDGTEALEDLDDDDWRVNRLTPSRIRISAPDPDIVVFVRIA